MKTYNCLEDAELREGIKEYRLVPVLVWFWRLGGRRGERKGGIGAPFSERALGSFWELGDWPWLVEAGRSASRQMLPREDEFAQGVAGTGRERKKAAISSVRWSA